MKSTVILALALAAVPFFAHAQDDAVKGKMLFSRCVACHAPTSQNKVGPGLAGIAGRAAGAASGFRYSKALAASGITWTDDILDTFLAAPAKAVPGTSMPISVPNPGDRSDIIAYLKTLTAP